MIKLGTGTNGTTNGGNEVKATRNEINHATTTTEALNNYDRIRADRIAGKASIHDQIRAVDEIGLMVGGKPFDSGMSNWE